MGWEAYKPDPEPSSSKDEDEMNEKIDNPQGPGPAEEELEADAASNAWSDPAMLEVQARDVVEDDYHYTLGFRTEQLRKLGKLFNYYLDKFNQTGVFIRHKH
jgi:hypothetical protein